MKRISLVVNSDNPETLTKAAESMARTFSWLVLEGVDVLMFGGKDEENEE